ncbi:MAG: hypothetical protein IKB64_03150 [Paludibacteraceae bacterium]|nr:hypothetical protein [Paludibacteraceae bacterium]
MKTLRLVGMALFAILMCVNFASCSNEENDIPQKGKEVIVSLGFDGDFEISESPLSRATSNDLYFIQIGQGSSASTAIMCAYGLFDDISKMKVKLIEGETYYFGAFILKDAKEVLKHTEYTYENSPFPFITELTNQFIFSDEDSYAASESQKIGVFTMDYTYSDDNIYQIPNLDFYVGDATEYTVAENSNVTIYARRWAFGANFVAENITDGSVKICMKKDSYISPTIELTSSQSTNDDIYSYSPAICGSDMENINLSVSFIWVKSDGTEVTLGTPTINFKRNVKTTVKINVDNTLENGIELNYDATGDMNTGDTYIVDGDTATKED